MAATPLQLSPIREEHLICLGSNPHTPAVRIVEGKEREYDDSHKQADEYEQESADP